MLDKGILISNSLYKCITNLKVKRIITIAQFQIKGIGNFADFVNEAPYDLTYVV